MDTNVEGEFKRKLQVQLETIDRKNPSSGNSETTKFQFVQNHHRDISTLLASNTGMLYTVALHDGVSLGRARYEQLNNMLLPIGPDPSVSVSTTVTKSHQ